jgi:coenzyme PQQ synthesis protein D (PqqD)
MSGIRFQRSTQALSRRVGPDLLVTTPDDVDVHELTGGAVAVWGNLSVPRTLSELIDQLAVAHGVPTAHIAEQVATCIDSLVAAGVVEEMLALDD